MDKEQAAANQLAKYETGKFNVLYPVISVGETQVSPLLVESVSVLSISPAAGSGETYNDFRYANERDGKYALTSLALAKIAAAAGLKWIPDLCILLERERRADGHVYVRYQAAAGVRQPNGEWHVEIQSKEIDTADVAEQLEDGYRRKLKAGRAKFSSDDIPDMVRREILQLREHVLSHAETKAKSRVIRRILALKQVYTQAELRNPFAVPRLVYRPDLTDPTQLERVQIEGSRAAAELYGEEADKASPSPALSDGSRAGAPPDTSAPYGEGGAEAPVEAVAASSSVRADDVAAAEAGPPNSDPVFDDGPHKGQHWSEVAEQHPEFLRGVISNTRAKAKRELMQAWLDHFYPPLGS